MNEKEESKSLILGRRTICWVGVAALLLFGSTAGVRALLSVSLGPEVQELRPVRVSVVREHRGTRGFHASGVTRANQQAQLAFTLGGRLSARHVELGDHVAAGAPLAEMDSRSQSNQVRAARAELSRWRAQLGNARRQHQVANELLEAEATSELELDNASSTVSAFGAGSAGANANLDEAARRLDETVLRAPFAGRVTDVLAEAGEVVAAGEPILVLSGGDRIEIEIEVPETDVRYVRPGMVVEVDLPLARLESLSGEVIRVGGAASLIRKTFPVVVAIDPRDGLMPGMAADVRFETDEEPSLAVPVRAVVSPGGQAPCVYAIREGRVVRVQVQVDGLRGEVVTVRGPLRLGDWVAVGGHAAITDGEAVLVVGTDETATTPPPNGAE